MGESGLLLFESSGPELYDDVRHVSPWVVRAFACGAFLRAYALGLDHHLDRFPGGAQPARRASVRLGSFQSGGCSRYWKTKSGGLARMRSRAACPSPSVSTSYCSASRRPDVISHVGVVISEKDLGGIEAGPGSSAVVARRSRAISTCVPTRERSSCSSHEKTDTDNCLMCVICCAFVLVDGGAAPTARARPWPCLAHSHRGANSDKRLRDNRETKFDIPGLSKGR
jgi:hypothetical protein